MQLLNFVMKVRNLMKIKNLIDKIVKVQSFSFPSGLLQSLIKVQTNEFRSNLNKIWSNCVFGELFTTFKCLCISKK